MQFVIARLSIGIIKSYATDNIIKTPHNHYTWLGSRQLSTYLSIRKPLVKQGPSFLKHSRLCPFKFTYRLSKSL